MSKERKARRFDQHFPISAISMEAEAEYVRREVDNYAVLAASDVEKWRMERHANCQNTWKHLCLILEAMPEKDRRVLQALMFRDLWYVLELYKTYLHPIVQQMLAEPRSQSPSAMSSSAFNEFLFDLK